MKFDVKKISNKNSRGQIFIQLDPEGLKESGLETGSKVTVIYKQGTIFITKEAKDVIL